MATAKTITAKNTRAKKVIEGMAHWGAFYRANIDQFAVEYLGFSFLKTFQLISLVMMDASRNYVWIASRGLGKSFLIAVFAVCRCILYPTTKVVIASGSRGQSINVLEKIRVELIPKSNALKNEIDFRQTKFAGQDACIFFKNGSTIKVVTAGDSARGNRANILIVDE